MKSLSALMKTVRRQREALPLRCGTCKRAPVTAAINRALADIKKRPEAYRGVTQKGLYEWCGAKAAGILFDSWRKHLIAHHDGALDILAGAN